MSRDVWDEIAEKLREGLNAEILSEPNVTSVDVVLHLLRSQPTVMFAPGKTVFDPYCGVGQLLVGAKWVKVLVHGMAESDAESELYGCDPHRENVAITQRRLPGATVLLGDPADPDTPRPGQTAEELRQLQTLL